MACHASWTAAGNLFCGRCGAALRQRRTLSSLALATVDRCKERWGELQTQAAGSAAKARQLADTFVRFLVDMGCETGQDSLFAATPSDVVWFFMERDTFGRTVVHNPECPYLRDGRSLANKRCGCPRRLKASTLDSAIGTLQGVFRDLGRTGPWCYRTLTGNPCDSREVKAFVKWSDKEQLSGGVETKRASLFDSGVYRALQKHVLAEWNRARSAGNYLEAASMARDALCYAIMWTTGLRAKDTLRLLSQGVEWFSSGTQERSAGWYLHIGGSKTETRARQARMFQLWDDGSLYVPMKAYGAYVASLHDLGLEIGPGPLFRELVQREDGAVVWGAASTYGDLNPRFRAYASDVGIPASVTLHSFHGSHAAELEAEGVPKAEICVEMAWQESTRAYYVDGRPILGLEELIRRTNAG